MADVPKIITAGASAAGGLFGSIASIFQHNKQLDLQRQENEKNRQFNAAQADLARRYNTEMVRQQREYDDPRAVMARLQAAGINPALAFSNGMPMMDMGVGSTGIQASTPAGSVGAAPSDFSGIMDFAGNAASALESLAGAESKQAMAKFTDIQAGWYDTLQRTHIADVNSNISLRGAMEQLTMEQRQKVLAEIETQDQLTNYWREQASNSQIQGKILDEKYQQETYETIFQQESLRGRIQMFADQVGITHAQAENAAKYFYWQAVSMAAEAAYKSAAASNQSEQAGYYQNLSSKAFFESNRLFNESPLYPMIARRDAGNIQWELDNQKTINGVKLFNSVLSSISGATSAVGGVLNAVNQARYTFGK